MRYASVCDGIGAAHVAFQPLGWECAWRSEIEPFPKSVVAHRWPNIGPDLGDMTKITDEELTRHGPIDLLCGGTPCQSFSVAGLRGGMADARGNLALVFLELARRARAEWLVWENVPGVLSSNGGRDFGSFLGALGELGYGFAYRSLDAQYFGLAQRRQRVFVVARLGDWRAPAAVLLERESLRGSSPPSQEIGDAVAFDWQSGGDARGLTPRGTAQLQRSQVPAVIASGITRRMTPRESERCFGFPDDYTLVPHRGKPAKDGPRYKALGNSWAVPVVRWIGERINMVSDPTHDWFRESRNSLGQDSRNLGGPFQGPPLGVS